MKTEIEYRLASMATTAKEMEVSGFAVRFNEGSVTMGSGDYQFIETILPEAIRAVDFSDTQLLYNHNRDNILGRTSAETLSLEVTDAGIAFRATLPDTQLGRDTYELVKRGDLQGCSFAMSIEEDHWDVKQSPATRTIKKIGAIPEISIVTDPAYPTTSIAKRALEHVEECVNCNAKRHARALEIGLKILDESDKRKATAKSLYNGINSKS